MKPVAEKVEQEKELAETKPNPKLTLLHGSAESEDQEFYDAAYSTPPRFIVQGIPPTTDKRLEEHHCTEASLGALAGSTADPTVDHEAENSDRTTHYLFPVNLNTNWLFFVLKFNSFFIALRNSAASIAR